MAMKYIKLFESWRLMEGEDDIDVFSPTSPKKFPVLNTTLTDLGECSDKQILKLFTSVLQRACQKDDGAFNINAGENVTVEVLDAGFINVYYGGSEKTYEKGGISLVDEFGLKGDAIGNFLKNSPIWAAEYKQRSQKDIQANAGFRLGNLVKISDGGDTAFYITHGALLNSKNSEGEKNESVIKAVINSPVYYVKKGQKVEIIEGVTKTTFGQWATFANQGMTEDNTNLLDKSNSKKYDSLCQGIFGGEGLTSAGKFAKTVKIGGQDLKLANGENGTIIPLYVAKDVMGTCGFDFNKATLKEDAKDTLSKKELWSILTNAKNSIEIIGHTDSIGTKEVNMALSKQRAESVLKFLQGMKDEYKPITQKKIKVTTTGMGFEEMVVDDKGGKDKDAAAKNRRVVIKVDGVGPDYKALLK